MKQAVIESGRAEFALEKVKNVVADKGNFKKNYRSYARKFPTLVLTNGLAAAVAFAVDKGKSEKAWKEIYDNVSDWLKEKLSDKKLEEYVCSLNSDEYRAVTNEVLALFTWIRRFASGLIEGDNND